MHLRLYYFAVVVVVCCVTSPAALVFDRQRRQIATSTTNNYDTLIQINDIVSLLGPRNEVDLVAVIARSISVGKVNFYQFERPLMEALTVQYATVHPSYVRTAAVTFAEDATVAYDQISNGNTESVTKCELFQGTSAAWNAVTFDNNPAILHGTSLKDAFQLAVGIYTAGKQNRPNATQVMVVMTDGDYQPSEDPLQYLTTLNQMNVVIFSVGVGDWLKTGSVRNLATKSSYYGQMQDWIQLVSTVMSSVPSSISPFWSSVVDTSICSSSNSSSSSSNSSSSSSTSCPDNSKCYCDVDRGLSQCLCDTGYQPMQSNNPTQSLCQACPPNTYRDDLDLHSCQSCSPGYGTIYINESLAVDGCHCLDGNNCTDPCSVNQCSANEECLALDATNSTCICRPGWTSSNCSILQDFCSAPSASGQQQQQPVCQNGGTCYAKVDDYQCICTFGFTGRHCEVMVDICFFPICMDNSTCVNGPNSFRCVCTYGFYGGFCENVDPSASPPPSASATPANSSSASGSSTAASSGGLSTPVTSTTHGFNDTTGRSNPADPSDLKSQTSSSSSETQLIIIIVCVVGGAILLLFIILLVVILMTCRPRRRRQRKEAELSKETPPHFQTSDPYGINQTGSRSMHKSTVSSRFSGYWKKWTVRAQDGGDWCNKGGVPSVPKRRPELTGMVDPRAVDREEAILENEVITVDNRLDGWRSYLQDLEYSSCLERGILAQMETKSCGMSRAWSLDWPELESLTESSMKVDQEVRLQGYLFRIQKKDGALAIGFSQAENDVQSKQTTGNGENEAKAVCIGVTKSYLIVGISGLNDRDKCAKEIQWIADHIAAEGY